MRKIRKGPVCSRLAGLLSVTLLLAFPACTYVPFDEPRPPLPEPNVEAKRASANEVYSQLAVNSETSAFLPLVEGNDALGARLEMIKSAKATIDIQTFLLKSDLAGGLIVRELIGAANRGVLVRLLVDDVFTTANDAQLALLSSHPKIFVRLYNPMSRRSTTVMNYVLDFSRVNRRMHNKVFLTDGAFAIVGGRNIGDEYYQINTDSEFADFDIFIAGPVAQELEKSFEIFWNDRWAVPVSTLAGTATVSEEELLEIKEATFSRATEAEKTTYERAVSSQFIKDVREGRSKGFYSGGKVVSDRPEKLRVPVADAPERHIAEAMVNRIHNAKRRVTVFTPYFVPEDWGAKLFSDLAQRGVQVQIVTNSLAATNHAYVHAGYMRHREQLLRAGVELYEVRADVPELLAADDGEHPKLTMHSKVALIDDAIMIGSLNFDPRSIKINSEIGLFIDNPAITREIERGIDADFDLYTFALELDENGKLQWVYELDGRREIYHSEPGASFGQKALAGITSLLPVEGQL